MADVDLADILTKPNNSSTHYHHSSAPHCVYNDNKHISSSPSSPTSSTKGPASKMPKLKIHNRSLHYRITKRQPRRIMSTMRFKDPLKYTKTHNYTIEDFDLDFADLKFPKGSVKHCHAAKSLQKPIEIPYLFCEHII